jgi:hypothetical protein
MVDGLLCRGKACLLLSDLGKASRDKRIISSKKRCEVHGASCLKCLCSIVLTFSTWNTWFKDPGKTWN